MIYLYRWAQNCSRGGACACQDRATPNRTNPGVTLWHSHSMAVPGCQTFGLALGPDSWGPVRAPHSGCFWFCKAVPQRDTTSSFPFAGL